MVLRGPCRGSGDTPDLPVSGVREYIGMSDLPTCTCIESREVFVGGIPDRPVSDHDFALGSGKPFPGYGGVLLIRDYLDAIENTAEAFPQESGAGLRLFDFTSRMDTGDGMHWPGSACWSYVLDK